MHESENILTLLAKVSEVLLENNNVSTNQRFLIAAHPYCFREISECLGVMD